MRVRLPHGHSSSGSPAQKTVLDQVGFVDILYGSAVLSYSRCQGVQTYGTPGKFFYNGPQQQPVGLIQTVFIHLQQIQGQTGHFSRNPSLIFYLSEVPDPLQQAVGKSRGAPGSPGKLPGAFMSFAPIVVPIILMGVASAFSMAGSNPAIIVFLGKPIIALAVGLILGVILMAQSGKMGEFYVLTDDTLKTVGPILFVTAAGGVLGKVIATTDLVNFITAHAATLESLGLLFPFLLAAILKTAQGSSTVAITTSAGIIAPLMMTLGFTTPLDAALVVVAIGAGAMTVSHANDSYFWVVTNFGEMEPQDGYKTQTLGTLIIGIAAIINVLIVSAIF